MRLTIGARMREACELLRYRNNGEAESIQAVAKHLKFGRLRHHRSTLYSSLIVSRCVRAGLIERHSGRSGRVRLTLTELGRAIAEGFR
jgi:hypothetical protein